MRYFGVQFKKKLFQRSILKKTISQPIIVRQSLFELNIEKAPFQIKRQNKTI